MIKVLNTANFFITENTADPLILFTFSQFQDNVEEVYITVKNDVLNIHYPSGDIFVVEFTENRLKERLLSTRKIIITEVDEVDGEIVGLYEAKLKKPA